MDICCARAQESKLQMSDFKLVMKEDHRLEKTAYGQYFHSHHEVKT